MIDETALRALLDDWLATWTGNRPDALLRFYALDAYYQDPARPGGLRGHAEIAPYFGKLLAANPDWVWRAVEVLPTAGGCCLKWEARVPRGAASVGLTGLDIVEIRAGRIARNEVYFDPAPLR